MNRKLAELARLYGIETSYVDMAKRHQSADPEALLLALCAMGAGVEKFDDVPEALARRKAELDKRTVEPVMVAWDGKLSGRKFEFGYHIVEMKGQEVFVISAPKKAHYEGEKERTWGVFAPIYALHSKRNPAAGDLTDFENLMDWTNSLGGSVAATLPLLGAFLDKPFEPSPYSPATRLFWNEFYIDVERIPEFAGHSKPQPPPKTKFVDYRAVMAWKRRILEALSREFFSSASAERRQAFRRFVNGNKNINDYAKFRAVTDRRQAGWTSWPSRLRVGNLRKGDYDEETKAYHLYAQWVVQDQIRSLSQRAAARGQFFYLDLPLGLHADSYDIWRDREFFVDGVKGGAPPDPVFTKGQNWGFPPMNPETMRLNRYQYVIEYLRNHFRYAKLLRIDHVMGLHRLYWIPDALTAAKGVYVKYPAEELWAIFVLESHLHEAGIVGENLGTVPPEVNAAMARHDIREMYVMQYEIMGDPDKPTLRPTPARSIASLNTHDMPPFKAFLGGLDIEDRSDLGLLDEKTARTERKQRRKMKRFISTLAGRAPAMTDACKALQLLSRSNANVVLVNLEDLWEETLPQNVPATSSERPNWRRRIRPSLEQIRKMAGIAEVLSDVFADRSRPVSV